MENKKITGVDIANFIWRLIPILVIFAVVITAINSILSEREEEQKETTETSYVWATVEDKMYQEKKSDTIPVMIGKIPMLLHKRQPELYNVTCVYEDLEIIINNKEIYNSVDVGEQLQIKKITTYKNGKEINSKLYFPEESEE